MITCGICLQIKEYQCTNQISGKGVIIFCDTTADYNLIFSIYKSKHN